MLCMPIRDAGGGDYVTSSSCRILGVISLLDKANGGRFSENDERFVEAFAIFCGMAIRNAKEYERAVVSEAKLNVG